MPSIGVVKDDLIHMGTVGKHRRHPGFGQHIDPGAGEIMPDGTHRGRGHDGIADPVGGSDEQAIDMSGQALAGIHVAPICLGQAE